MKKIITNKEKYEKKKQKKKEEEYKENKKRWRSVVLGSVFMVVLVVLILRAGFSTLVEKYLAKHPPAEARVEIPIHRTYDFSLTTVPGEVKVPFRQDTWSEITLPAAVVFRTDPSSDIEIIFIDGSQYIDGPGQQVWYGLKRGIFKTRGLTKAGILKITLEKKI